jgi:hypothetical protein
MSDIDIRRQALREIAKEKARIKGEVLSYKEKPEQETKELQEEGMPFKQARPEKIVLKKRRKDDSSFSWTQFNPWRRESAKKKLNTLNTATIWCMAKKMIAQEWREAKGVKKRNPRLDHLEQEAAMWGEKQEEERRRQEEASARFEKQRVKVDEALKIIGQKILEEKGNLTAKGATTLIKDAMGTISKVHDVEWRENGCDIWIEPWEDRWSHQNRELPTIYKIGINDKLEMVSYDLIEDEDARLKVKEEVFARGLKESPDDEPLGVYEEDIKDTLEKRIAKAGRLIELEKLKENIWIATVEPWDQMKIRNIERMGKGPIETETIVAKVVDGKIITAPIKGNKSWEKRVENKSKLGIAQKKGGEDVS